MYDSETGSLSNGTGFSEMQIVDCDHLGEDKGCDGGDITSAMNWTILNGGLVAEESVARRGRLEEVVVLA